MIFPRDKNHSKGACLQLLQTAVPAQVPWAMQTPALLNYPTGPLATNRFTVFPKHEGYIAMDLVDFWAIFAFLHPIQQ